MWDNAPWHRSKAELERLLGLDEIEARVFAWYRCGTTDHLIQPLLYKTEQAA